MWRRSLSKLGGLEEYKSDDITEARGAVRLNSNENLFVPFGLMKKLAMRAARTVDLRLYPDRVLVDRFISGLSNYVNVETENIAVDNGSDPLIDQLFMAFFRKGGKAVVTSPSFSMYSIRANVFDVPCVRVNLDPEFQLNVDDLLRSSKGASVIFICRPNNPTGTFYPREQIQEILERTNCIIVVDEAYIEFSDERSLCDKIDHADRLVVMRSFSKAFGGAGLRLGYLIASRRIVQMISRKLQHPYEVGSFPCMMGCELLNNVDVFRNLWERVRLTREMFVREVNKMSGVKAFASQGNFVMIALERDPRTVRDELAMRGFLVKSITKSSSRKYANLIRVTVGPPPTMRRFISTLDEVITGE